MDFRSDAWRQYTLAELGDFIHLLVKRSQHHKRRDLQAKDLIDARAYWRMMGALLDAEGDARCT